jgi:hypothetical protein
VAHPSGRPDDLRYRGGRPGPARGAVEEVRPGDRVDIEPGENHWHGATPTRFHAQFAYQEADDSGGHTTWDRHLTDEEYPG